MNYSRYLKYLIKSNSLVSGRLFSAYHVGIVESVVDGNIYTVEGNSGDKVARRSYPIGYGQIVGYGVPAY